MPETVTEIPKALFDATVQMQIRTGRYASKTVRDIIGLLNQADADILRKIAATDAPFTKARLAALLKEIRTAYKEIYSEAGTELKQQMLDFAGVRADQTAALIATQLPVNYNIIQATAEQLKAIVDVAPVTVGPDKKLLLEEIFTSLAAGKEESIRGAIRLGMVEGETVDEMVRRIKGTKAAQYKDGLLEIHRRHAESIVRTVTNHVSNQAMQATYANNAKVVSGWVFTATLDGATSLTCRSLAGTVWPIGKGPIPPRHVRCLPGDALVSSSSGITAVSKRWYDGNMIIIKTASSRILSCTPNHPILTPGGWVAAGLLNVGGHVISDGGSKWGSNIDSNDKDMPTRIEDVAKAFLSSGKMMSMPVPLSPEDFHGDGVGSKIAIISAYRELWLSGDTPLGEHTPKLKFISRDCPASCICPLDKFGPRTLNPSNRIMGGPGKFLTFIGRGAGHASKLLLASVTCFNSLFAEKFSQIGCRAVAKPFRYPAYPYTRVEQLNSSSNINHRSDITSGAERATNGLNTRPNRFVVDSVLNSQFSSGGTCYIFSGKDLGRGKSGRFPHHDASSLQPGKDSDITDIELACKILGGASGEVFPDEIVGIEIRSFSGHVYNLQTESNWYVAQGIVSHNCRSIAIPELKTFRELGFDVDELPPGMRSSKDGLVRSDISMDEWMRTQSKSEIVDMLGKTRADLFTSGKLKISNFADDKGIVYTLEELKKKHPGLISK